MYFWGYAGKIGTELAECQDQRGAAVRTDID